MTVIAVFAVPVPPVPLWNHALAFALLLALLACEWLVRRRERLV